MESLRLSMLVAVLAQLCHVHTPLNHAEDLLIMSCRQSKPSITTSGISAECLQVRIYALQRLAKTN